MIRDTDILKAFGERVRELREERGYSQESFADHCGLDRTDVGGVERGERNVALRNIKANATAFDVSIAELVKEL